MTEATRWVGIDLGASTLHVVVLGPGSDPGANGRAEVLAAHTFEVGELNDVVALAAGAARIAIDAPDQLSTAPHRDDESLSPKFRVARCGEIALGQIAKIWVPWVTPSDPALVAGWMETGFRTWAALRGAGHEPIEVYPAGVFRVLNGKVPAKKSTLAGLRERVALLTPHVVLPDEIDMWSHDGIDAIAAALVARWSIDGRATRVGHGDPEHRRSRLRLVRGLDPQPCVGRFAPANRGNRSNGPHAAGRNDRRRSPVRSDRCQSSGSRSCAAVESRYPQRRRDTSPGST